MQHRHTEAEGLEMTETELDTIVGGALAGNGEIDLVRGRDGNDVLIGNQGNDFVFGENGNDLIVA